MLIFVTSKTHFSSCYKPKNTLYHHCNKYSLKNWEYQPLEKHIIYWERIRACIKWSKYKFHSWNSLDTVFPFNGRIRFFGNSEHSLLAIELCKKIIRNELAPFTLTIEACCSCYAITISIFTLNTFKWSNASCISRRHENCQLTLCLTIYVNTFHKVLICVIKQKKNNTWPELYIHFSCRVLCNFRSPTYMLFVMWNSLCLSVFLLLLPDSSHRIH